MQMNHNRYLKLQKIGEGAYAVVYKALDSETNQTVALKKFKFDVLLSLLPSHTSRASPSLRFGKSPSCRPSTTPTS